MRKYSRMCLGAFIFSFILFMYGCVDTIDIKLPDNVGGRLVIEGSVERGPDAYLFRASVRRTAQDIRDIVLKLEQADISLIMNDEEVLFLENNEPLTVNIDSFHTQYGAQPSSAQFRIRAVLEDGRIFESTNQQVLSPSRFSSLDIKMNERLIVNSAGILVEEEFLELLVNTALENDQAEKLSFVWEVSGVYKFEEVAWTDDPAFFPATCYVNVPAPPNEVNVLLATDIGGEVLEKHKIAETVVDFRFVSGYYYSVLQKTVDVNAGRYWEQVAANIGREGTLFDPPAGRIETNIRNIEDEQDEVLGYFYAAGIDTVRYLTTPGETGNQRHPCSLDPTLDFCCDCIANIFNSSLSKPSYWD